MKPIEFFDDCPICRAMKFAFIFNYSRLCLACLMKAAKEEGREPTEAELKEAFKKAKEGGAIVGGEWFEEDKK